MSATTPSLTAVEARGGDRGTGLLWRAAHEFVVVPALVIVMFALLAAVSVVLDQSHAGWIRGLRHSFGHFVGANSASGTLTAIATGLVTVTSITFSVLLLAIQQAASNLSPVVFDQFVRRRSNQVFLGFFVGLALYSYVTLAAVQQSTPPILGATMAVVLTVVALIFLLALVYTTIDQMRPTNVVQRIRDHALAARSREAAILSRTLRTARRHDDVSATFRSEVSGYVIAIDLDAIARVIAELPNAEIELLVTLGSHVTCGDVVAVIRDDDITDVEHLAEILRTALRVSSQRDISLDASAAVDELANIVWTSASSAKQNPEIARGGLDVLRDLLAHWASREVRHDDEERVHRVAVVYSDHDVERVLDAIVACTVAAHEAHQSQTVASVLDTWCAALDNVDGAVAARIGCDVTDVAGIVREADGMARLRRSVERLTAELERRGETVAACTLRDILGSHASPRA